MPLSGELFSVDTLQVRPVEEAFRAGRLAMPVAPSGGFSVPEPLWADSPVNGILICVTAVAMVLLLSQLVELLPFLMGGIFRNKPAVDLEDSVRHARDRNALAIAAIPAFVLVVSRFGLYDPDWLADFSAGARTLLLLAVWTAFILLRMVLVSVAWHPRINRETYGLSARTFYNFFILATLLLVLTVGLLTLLGGNPLSIKMICWVEMGLSYLLFLVRRTQILRNSCNQFTAILYLCGLELLPAGLLVASAVFM